MPKNYYDYLTINDIDGTSEDIYNRDSEARTLITSLKSDTENSITNLKNDTEKSISDIKKKHYMVVIGDSFSSTAQSGGPLWYTYVAAQKNLQVYTNASDGMGFIVGGSNDFNSQLTKAYDALKKETVDILYIFGGLNDMNSSKSGLEIGNACKALIERAMSLFPNTKIEVYGPENFPTVHNESINTSMWMSYICSADGVEYHNVSQTFQLFPGFFGGKTGSNVHPTAAGEKMIAACILNHGALPFGTFVASESTMIPQANIAIAGVAVPSESLKYNVLKTAYNDFYFNFVISKFSNCPTSGQINVNVPGGLHSGLSNSGMTYITSDCYISQVGNQNTVHSGWSGTNQSTYYFGSSGLTLGPSMSDIRINIAIHDR